MEMEEKSIKGKTVGDLVEFLIESVESHHYRPSTVVPLRIAVGKIMRETTDESKDWRAVLLRDIDLDERMKRFRESTIGICSDGTARIYKMRFERAIEIFAKEERKKNQKLESLLSFRNSKPSTLSFECLSGAVESSYFDSLNRARSELCSEKEMLSLYLST